MAKREITRAAKRAGFAVTEAHYGWTATPGEMVPSWEIQFHPVGDEEGYDIKDFASTREAVEFFDALAAANKENNNG